MNQARFNHLFNILLPADDPSHEIDPDHHNPLKPKASKHIISGILLPDIFCSAGVTLESHWSSTMDWGNLPQGCRGSLRCRVTHILSGHWTQGKSWFRAKKSQAQYYTFQYKPREDTVLRKDFGKWMIKHIDQWFAWCQRIGLGIDQMENIVLLTGIDLAKSSANVAFLGGQVNARVSFGVEVAGSKIYWKFSPERKSGAAVWNWGPSGEV
ncbi:hypothetical protein EI94DRAFT_1315721 [Lactarius quietus]|nr:hypothetical protein EI94DRAFT_1315721 [Lactarius quietus]